jgi:D-alanyl-D-alanine carboxypeptidase
MDDFESGALAGWQAVGSGAGGWFVYSDGSEAPDPEQSDPNVPFFVPDPPQGRFAALTDMNGPGTRVLYRDVGLDGRFTLRLTVFYEGSVPFSTPDTLAYDSPEPNQQFRIDLVDPTAPIDSVAEGDVLINVFHTSPADPISLAPTAVSVDLSPWAGQTVRLRLAQSDNQGPLRGGVDNIRFAPIGAGADARIELLDTPEPTACLAFAACSSQPPSASVTAGSSPSPAIRLRDFPAFPDQPFSERVAASLQGVIDEAVEEFGGISAAVIVGNAGHWSGAAGVDLRRNPLTTGSHVQIASIGKTVTAAQVLRLVEEGEIGIDDPAADHLPPELDGYDANGATVRELLGMRSGIGGPASHDAGATIPELVEMLPEPAFPAGSTFSYESMNYVLLGSIIEHVTHRSLWEVLRSDVLHRPGLGGLRYPVRNALAADGSLIESDPASLARWGYELYGGSVLSAASLRTMTDFEDYEGQFYGLGTFNMSIENAFVDEGFGVPAIGHDGIGAGIAATLVAFPRTGEVVSLQTLGSDPNEHKTLIDDLLEVVRAAAIG